MKLIDFPFRVNEHAGDAIYFMPQVQAVVYEPPSGFTPAERIDAERTAIIEAYTQAAMRGEVAIIKDVKLKPCECVNE